MTIDNHLTTLPLKKGLSSSAAVCVLVVRALCLAYGLELSVPQVWRAPLVVYLPPTMVSCMHMFRFGVHPNLFVRLTSLGWSSRSALPMRSTRTLPRATAFLANETADASSPLRARERVLGRSARYLFGLCETGISRAHSRRRHTCPPRNARPLARTPDSSMKRRVAPRDAANAANAAGER